MTIFVERRFEMGDTDVVARFSTPTKATGGEFQCHYELDWPDHEDRGYASGEDGVQALMLAMKKVHFALVKSDAYRKGQLTLWGQLDLDLPPTWGTGPLYFAANRSGETPGDYS